jgi:putative ABC transport system permease protein
LILWLVLRTLRNRFGPNLLTLLAVALAVGVALAVPLTLSGLREGAIRASGIFNLLVTAKGSPTQAMLNTIFLQEAPVGNIPFALYQKLKTDARTQSAIPMGFGDNYNGFPIVGTNTDFFELREKLTDPNFYRLERGTLFSKPFEAVLGAQAARVAGLKFGDRFKAAHGVQALIEADEHAKEFTVVGILEPTGGPGDRGIYVDIQTIWETHEENHATNEASADTHDTDQHNAEREVTAVLYTPKRLGYVYQVASQLESGKYLPGVSSQAVFPGQTVGRLLDLLGQGRVGYTVIGSLVLVLALATVAVNTYASALTGQRNLAILRAIGARAVTVIAVVLLESLVVTALGVLLGIGLAYLGTLVAGLVLQQNVGLSLPILTLELGDALRVLTLLPVAVFFALFPALAASRRSPLERLG